MITEAQLDWVVINVYQQTNTCLFPVIVFLLNFMFIRFNVIDFIQQQYDDIVENRTCRKGNVGS